MERLTYRTAPRQGLTHKPPGNLTGVAIETPSGEVHIMEGEPLDLDRFWDEMADTIGLRFLGRSHINERSFDGYRIMTDVTDPMTAFEIELHLNCGPVDADHIARLAS